MAHETIITCEEVIKHLGDPGWVLVDCRYQLADREYGRHHYRQSHLPRAVYVSLDDDLTGPVIPGVTGRHPLPDKVQVVGLINRLGIASDTQVVVYDEQAGQMAAARLWWLLKWAGHTAVAVLDGGFLRWQGLELPTETGERHNTPTLFQAEFQDHLVVTAADVTTALDDPSIVLVDSRAADRYRGENETIDPVAGHIPGAVSVPFLENIADAGVMKSPQALRERFVSHIGTISGDRAIFYCGSGVTAAQNVLAYTHAGLGMPRLYVGSWSDWITDRSRPVACGDNPGGVRDQPVTP